LPKRFSKKVKIGCGGTQSTLDSTVGSNSISYRASASDNGSIRSLLSESSAFLRPVELSLVWALAVPELVVGQGVDRRQQFDSSVAGSQEQV